MGSNPPKVLRPCFESIYLTHNSPHVPNPVEAIQTRDTIAALQSLSTNHRHVIHAMEYGQYQPRQIRTWLSRECEVALTIVEIEWVIADMRARK